MALVESLIFQRKLDFRWKLPEKRVTENDDGRFWTFLAKNLIRAKQSPDFRVTKNGVGLIFTFSAELLILKVTRKSGNWK